MMKTVDLGLKQTLQCNDKSFMN